MPVGSSGGCGYNLPDLGSSGRYQSSGENWQFTLSVSDGRFSGSHTFGGSPMHQQSFQNSSYVQETASGNQCHPPPTMLDAKIERENQERTFSSQKFSFGETLQRYVSETERIHSACIFQDQNQNRFNNLENLSHQLKTDAETMRENFPGVPYRAGFQRSIEGSRLSQNNSWPSNAADSRNNISPQNFDIKTTSALADLSMSKFNIEQAKNELKEHSTQILNRTLIQQENDHCKKFETKDFKRGQLIKWNDLSNDAQLHVHRNPECYKPHSTSEIQKVYCYEPSSEHDRLAAQFIKMHVNSNFGKGMASAALGNAIVAHVENTDKNKIQPPQLKSLGIGVCTALGAWGGTTLTGVGGANSKITQGLEAAAAGYLGGETLNAIRANSKVIQGLGGAAAAKFAFPICKALSDYPRHPDEPPTTWDNLRPKDSPYYVKNAEDAKTKLAKQQVEDYNHEIQMETESADLNDSAGSDVMPGKK